MALKGNLRDFSFSQLLNLISLAKKTGTLEVHGPEKAASISFDDGKLSYAQNSKKDHGLAAVLLRSEKLTEKQYQVIKDKANNMGETMNKKTLRVLEYNKIKDMLRQQAVSTMAKEK